MTDNIIANNCTGSRLYQQMGKQYGNPFMWCVINPEDFLYLYNHYYEIDYWNYELVKKNGEYQIIIDGKITVQYVHYKYGENDTVPTKKNNDMDIYYDKIEQYIVEKYENRLKRMIQPPFFIISDREYLFNKKCIFSNDDLKYYLNKDNCIIATCNRDIVGRNVIYTHDKNVDPEEIARTILQNMNHD